MAPLTKRIHFINQLEGWVLYGFSDMNILKTSDGGFTWENQLDPPLPDSYPEDIYFTDSKNGWAVGWHGNYRPPAVILHTSNGGSTWKVIDFLSSHGLYNIGFANKDVGWILGENGSILYTTNGGTSFVDQYEYNDLTNIFSLSQNYPNPFNPATKIKYTIPSVETRHVPSLQIVTLKIYDILGREVATLINEGKPTGEYEVEFYGSNLPSGIYCYQLKAGTFIETRKMVLLK